MLQYAFACKTIFFSGDAGLKGEPGKQEFYKNTMVEKSNDILYTIKIEQKNSQPRLPTVTNCCTCIFEN